jgi:hypothetical protein
LLKTHDMNHLSDYERVLLYCTLESIFNEDDFYTCHKCLKSYANESDEGKREAMVTKMRKLKGCWGTIRGGYKIEEYEIGTCIGNYSTHQVHDFFGWYLKYEQFGILPYAGSLYDQPAKIMEIFDLIGNFKYKKMKEREEKQRLKDQTNRLRGK